MRQSGFSRGLGRCIDLSTINIEAKRMAGIFFVRMEKIKSHSSGTIGRESIDRSVPGGKG